MKYYSIFNILYFSFFFNNFNINSRCLCNNKNNKINNNDNDKNGENLQNNKDNKKNNDFLKKNKKEIKIDEKYLKDYKICNEKCFFEYENNNCAVKSTLSIFCKIFNKKKIIEDWLKSDNIVLKTLGEILKRYNKNDKSKKDYDIFFHNLERFFVDYYNNNIKIQKSKTKPDEDFKEIMNIFLDFFGNYKFKEIQKDNRLITFSDLFNNVESLEYRKYNDYLSRFNLLKLITLINKFYPLNYKMHKIHYFQVENDIYTIYDDNFNNIFYIDLNCKYYETGHNCLIFKENDKFYFENCNNVFEINGKLVEACFENRNYQPIIDIYIKEGGINYKYDYSFDFIYLYKNKTMDDAIYECTKNDILLEYNYYKENDKNNLDLFTADELSEYYELDKNLIRKILLELNINI